MCSPSSGHHIRRSPAVLEFLGSEIQTGEESSPKCLGRTRDAELPVQIPNFRMPPLTITGEFGGKQDEPRPVCWPSGGPAGDDQLKWSGYSRSTVLAADI